MKSPAYLISSIAMSTAFKSISRVFLFSFFSAHPVPSNYDNENHNCYDCYRPIHVSLSPLSSFASLLLL